jgi:hypothetical protein
MHSQFPKPTLSQFIVYNTGQINLKYLLRVKFHYY